MAGTGKPRVPNSRNRDVWRGAARRYLGGARAEDVARAYGVSGRTVRRWAARLAEEEGRDGQA